MNLSYLFDAAHWSLTADGSIPQLILSHLWYVLLALVIGTVIALPVGLWIGHTGRFRGLVVGVTGAMRALPTLGLLTLIVLWRGIGLTPPISALVVLAIPPLLAGAYAGVESVDRRTVDAALGDGVTRLGCPPADGRTRGTPRRAGSPGNNPPRAARSSAS